MKRIWNLTYRPVFICWKPAHNIYTEVGKVGHCTRHAEALVSEHAYSWILFDWLSGGLLRKCNDWLLPLNNMSKRRILQTLFSMNRLSVHSIKR